MLSRVFSCENIKIRNIGCFLSANILLIVAARFKFHAFYVDISLQSLLWILLPLVLGPKLSLAAVGAYLIEGAMGYPVFQGTPERGVGIAYMLGTTGGYLMGMVVAQGVGYFVRSYDAFIKIFFGLLFGHICIHLCGVMWLSVLLGLNHAVTIDSQFWLGSLIKVIIGTLTLHLLKK